MIELSKNYRVSALGLAAAGALAVLLCMGALQAHATEITGTLGTGGGSGSGGTTDNGGMSGTVVGGTPDQTTSDQGGSTQTGGASQAAPSSAPSGGSGGSPAAARSGHSAQSGTSAAAPTSVQSQSTGAAQTPSYGGTGGGFDAGLDSYLSSLQGGSSALSAGDAIAYNRSSGPIGGAANMAAAAEAGTPGQKAMAIILVSLAVAGLAGYAVNAYMIYRKERGF